jgi:signal transduction histidine kinase
MRILVVEDDTAIADALQVSLKVAGRAVDVCADVLAGFAPASADRDHARELRCDDTPAHVHGNALLFELALRNLIDNAIAHPLLCDRMES